MLQSSCVCLDEGNVRREKGLADKNLDEIEAAQKINQLVQEKQEKAQQQMEIVHMEKRKITDKHEEKVTKKLKSQ